MDIDFNEDDDNKPERFDLGDYFNNFSLKIMKGVIPSKHFIGQESKTYGTHDNELLLTVFVKDFNAIFDSINAISTPEREDQEDNL